MADVLTREKVEEFRRAWSGVLVPSAMSRAQVELCDSYLELLRRYEDLRRHVFGSDQRCDTCGTRECGWAADLDHRIDPWRTCGLWRARESGHD